MQKARVVITGIGLVTPLGLTTSQTWNALCEGKSGISKLSENDFPSLSFHVGGVISNLQPSLSSFISPSKQRRTDRFIQLGLLAAHEALNQSGLLNYPSFRENCGVYLGVGIGGLKTISESTREYDRAGSKAISPFLLTRVIPNEAPAWISMEYELQGPIFSVANACASGADAIGLAYKAIAHGTSDFMVAGGTESCITELSLSSFGNMRVLSSWKGDPTQASRPFSRDRCGFAMAEGAGILVLEKEEHARKRGALIIAEIVGYGSSSDAYHITALHPEARGTTQALQKALRDACINPHDVNYINAHGTATEMNDPMETHALKKIFGEYINAQHSKHILVSSTKSMTGHMLGATGATEIAFSALALQHQIAPPTINLYEKDPLCDLDYVPHIARAVPMKYALSNSFGFGGGNAVVTLKKYD